VSAASIDSIIGFQVDPSKKVE